ncbi:TRAP transporter large permease [Rhodovulum adriaticum]|uniref:Tripartite ATP-independent transporter DctM subunit n=1 Tax=Rhodovulum adriaticum TaxID=35804 RepID=A0A4R2NM76_RHOAD|nr:TRAP transporter large permease subunit [Rhodovulum adriaticum]MBK1636718.1 tripartite transporter [Rhodovulum adriaticum]TCP22763.1 tripartite ATP-independent transporter DctM subunit [Rhodovulum adriaticum]
MTVEAGFLLAMLVGLFAGILSGIPAMLAIAGVPMLTALIGAGVGVFDLDFLNFFPGRVWGVMSNRLLMAVPLFVLMGVLLERARLAERMLGVLGRLTGGSARGMGLSVLAFSTLIAASTGIIGATVVMLVLISLPAMRAAGVDKRLAAGLVCASGTLGQVIPPSIILVLLGDQIGNVYLEAQQAAGNFAPDPVSVGDLFAGALVPGLMLVGLYAVYLAIRLKPAHNAVPTPRDPVPMGEVVFTFLPPILLILAVLGSILAGVATTTEAAGLGAIGALFLAGYGTEGGRTGRWAIAAGALAALVLVAIGLAGLGRAGAGSIAGAVALAAGALIGLGTLAAGWRTWRAGLLPGAMEETIRISGMVFGIVVAAALLSLVFRGFGGDRMVADLMAGLPGGGMTAIALVMALIFVLGFILEAVEIIYIVVPLLGPPILGTDISPVWFAILIAMNLQTSFLTPPFGFALFYFRSVAPRDISTVDTYRGVLPFVLLQLMALGVLIAVPGLATWLPDLIFR